VGILTGFNWLTIGGNTVMTNESSGFIKGGQFPEKVTVKFSEKVPCH
jgi:hypothetical protein